MEARPGDAAATVPRVAAAPSRRLRRVVEGRREQAERFPWNQTIELLLAIHPRSTDLSPTPPKLRVA